MDDSAKLEIFQQLIAPDTEEEYILLSLLDNAASIVLNRRYPFGYPEGTIVPARYEYIQIRIAVELFSKRGAEGQLSHSENGVSRTFESSDVSKSLLAKVIPKVGSVEDA